MAVVILLENAGDTRGELAFLRRRAKGIVRQQAGGGGYASRAGGGQRQQSQDG